MMMDDVVDLEVCKLETVGVCVPAYVLTLKSIRTTY